MLHRPTADPSNDQPPHPQPTGCGWGGFVVLCRVRVLAFTSVLMLAAGCSGSEPAPPAATVTVTESAAEEAAPPAPSVDPLDAAPDIRFTSNCQDDYPVVFLTGDLSENTATGYRFVGDIVLTNRGDAAGYVTAQMRWLLVGGEEVRSDPQTVKVPPGARRKVGFSKPTTVAELQGMAAHASYEDQLCRPLIRMGR